MRLGDRDLGADAVGGGGQQRPVGSALSAEASKRPAKPPMPPITSGRRGLVDPGLHQLDGPVAGLDVDAGGGVRRPVGCSGSWHGRARRRRHGRLDAASAVVERRRGAGPVGGDRARVSSRCLPSSSRLGQLDRVDAVEAGPAEAGRRAASVASTMPVERDVAERVGADRRRRSPRRRGRWRSARRGWRSRCRRSTATSPAGEEIRTCTSAAPASRSIRTSARWVLPRTIESSTTTSRLPRDDVAQRVELEPDAELADRLADGWMKVRPT